MIYLFRILVGGAVGIVVCAVWTLIGYTFDWMGLFGRGGHSAGSVEYMWTIVLFIIGGFVLSPMICRAIFDGGGDVSGRSKIHGIFAFFVEESGVLIGVISFFVVAQIVMQLI